MPRSTAAAAAEPDPPQADSQSAPLKKPKTDGGKIALRTVGGSQSPADSLPIGAQPRAKSRPERAKSMPERRL